MAEYFLGTQTLKITNIYKNTLRNPKLLHVVNVDALELVLADISLTNNIARFRHPAALRNMGTLKFDPKLPKMAMLGLFDENVVNPNKKIREARFLEETSGSYLEKQESPTFFETKKILTTFPDQCRRKKKSDRLRCCHPVVENFHTSFRVCLQDSVQ